MKVDSQSHLVSCFLFQDSQTLAVFLMSKKLKLIPVEPPSGTRDFHPADFRVRNYLFSAFHSVSKKFGFSQYDCPILEHTQLYKRKAGDDIVKETYSFVDREGSELTLRPEMTPSLARMILSLTVSETGDLTTQLPMKWYSIPQCWRFETTQKGRKREHYQWNADIIGVETCSAEAEVVAMLIQVLKELGLKDHDVVVRVNSRELLQKTLLANGVTEADFPLVCVIIDKRGKMEDCQLAALLSSELGYSLDVSTTILEAALATQIEDDSQLSGFFDLIEAYGMRDFVIFDPTVVRGLSYYTGIIFEVFDRSGVGRAICGGGRYDNLLRTFGAKKSIPMVGFGFGDCVITDLLMEKGLLPKDLSAPMVDFVVAAYNQEMKLPAVKVAMNLREQGYSVDLMPSIAKKVGKAFGYADKAGANKMAFVAPGEWEDENGPTFVIKDLRQTDTSRKQQILGFPTTRDEVERVFE